MRGLFSKSYQNKIVNINGNLFIYTIVRLNRSNRSKNGAIMASLVIFITIQVNIHKVRVGMSTSIGAQIK